MSNRLVGKKIISGFLSLAVFVSASVIFTAGSLTVSAISSGIWDGTVATSFAGGNGTAVDPYLISTPQQLAYLGSLVQADIKEGITWKTYKLNADIYLNNVNESGWLQKNPREWTYGTNAGLFYGTLDGNGYVIKGIYINGGAGESSGLFPKITGAATFKNLGIVDSYIKGISFAGALAGQRVAWNSGSGVLINQCFSDSSVTLSGGVNGGLLGTALEKTTITNSYSTAVLNGTSTKKGGLIGDLYTTGIMAINTSYHSQGEINMVGNLFGYATYTNCYTTTKESLTGITGLYKVDAANMIGVSATTSMPALNFDSIWSCSDTTSPRLKIFNKAAVLESSVYSVADSMIKDIPATTPSSTFVSNVFVNSRGSTIKVLDVDNKDLNSGGYGGNYQYVGTGNIVEVYSGTAKVATYTAIVSGDVNGDGKNTILDLIKVKNHLLSKTLLADKYSIAADVDGVSGISLADLLTLKDSTIGKSVQQSFVPFGYELVWADEFDGIALDTRKWKLGWDMYQNNDLVLINNSNTIKVKDGLLQLNSILYSDSAKPEVKYATSNSVTTKDTMNYQYGYVEMCAMVPYKQGAWPSFWAKSLGTLGNRNTTNYFTEIDIFEVFSSPNTVIPNIHKWYTNTDGTIKNHVQYPYTKNKYIFENNLNLSEQYHVYGFEWTPESMFMYVDGTKYMTFNINNTSLFGDMTGFSDPIYLIINNFLFTPLSEWKPYTGCEVVDTALPISYYVDWVRLYQKPSVGALYTAN